MIWDHDVAGSNPVSPTNFMKCGKTKCDKNLSPQQEKGGQRFCSRACSNSAIPRLSSSTSKKKAGKSLSITRLANPRFSKIIKICPICENEFSVLYGSRNQKTCSTKCGKKLGGKTASVSMRARGTYSGWSTRGSEPSYPERYFISVFDNEKIFGWKREHKVGKWFIDFAFLDRMLAIEIDGKQHLEENRRKSDEAKDLFLTECGWTIVRIPWSDPQTQKGKDKLYPHIQTLKVMLDNSVQGV